MADLEEFNTAYLWWLRKGVDKSRFKAVVSPQMAEAAKRHTLEDGTYLGLLLETDTSVGENEVRIIGR